MGVVPDGVEEVTFRGFQDEGRDVAVNCGEMRCEGGADTDAVGDDLVGGDAAGSDEVRPGRLSVLGHSELIGMGVCTVTVASVIESEDIYAEVVESVECCIEV